MEAAVGLYLGSAQTASDSAEEAARAEPGSAVVGLHDIWESQDLGLQSRLSHCVLSKRYNPSRLGFPHL